MSVKLYPRFKATLAGSCEMVNLVSDVAQGHIRVDLQDAVQGHYGPQICWHTRWLLRFRQYDEVTLAHSIDRQVFLKGRVDYAYD